MGARPWLLNQLPSLVHVTKTKEGFFTSGLTNPSHSGGSSFQKTDADKYTKEEIAELYGFRWNVELDIRSIKQSLNPAHVRCKSPEMVRRELWTTFLGYNLIRTTAAAALLHGKQPRQISFTSTCQYVLSSWTLLSCDVIDLEKPQSIA